MAEAKPRGCIRATSKSPSPTLPRRESHDGEARGSRQRLGPRDAAPTASESWGWRERWGCNLMRAGAPLQPKAYITGRGARRRAPGQWREEDGMVGNATLGLKEKVIWRRQSPPPEAPGALASPQRLLGARPTIKEGFARLGAVDSVPTASHRQRPASSPRAAACCPAVRLASEALGLTGLRRPPTHLAPVDAGQPGGPWRCDVGGRVSGTERLRRRAARPRHAGCERKCRRLAESARRRALLWASAPCRGHVTWRADGQTPEGSHAQPELVPCARCSRHTS